MRKIKNFIRRLLAVMCSGLIALSGFQFVAIAADIARQTSDFKNAKKPEQKLEALGKLRRSSIGDQKAGAAIADEARKEKNPHMKARMVEAMSDFRQKETREAAREALKDPAPSVRLSAAYSLGFLAEPSDASELIKKFRDENETKGVRFQAANSLAMRGRDDGWPTEEIVKVFLEGIDSSDPEIRAQAITSLTFVAPDDVRTHNAVRKLLQDKDDFVKKTAEGRAEFLGISR